MYCSVKTVQEQAQSTRSVKLTCHRHFNFLNFEQLAVSTGWNCVTPENIHTPPPSDGQWKFLGGGGLRGRNFRGARGGGGGLGAHRKNFPQVQGKRHDRSYETYLSLCGLFWFVAQQKLEVDALSIKKKLQDVCLKCLPLCWEFAIISALMICPHARTICCNTLADCSYDLMVDSKQLTVDPSNVWLWQSL